MDLAKTVALMANHEIVNVVDYSVNEGGTGKISKQFQQLPFQLLLEQEVKFLLEQ